MSQEEKLTDIVCVPCQGGVPPLEPDEIADYQRQTPEWNVNEVDGVSQLQRVFAFKNYAQAVSFTKAVADLAEREDHHPAILLEWGRVSVSWWTHKINGLHVNDFVAAAKTDALFAA